MWKKVTIFPQENRVLEILRLNNIFSFRRHLWAESTIERIILPEVKK
jgi:hypothetical protein